MRYTLLTILFSLFLGHLLLYGQLEKSTHFIGSNSSYSTIGIQNSLGGIGINQRSDGERSFGFGIAPKYGRFLTDHWLFGSGFYFSTFNYQDRFFSISQELLRLEPFTRYYFNPDRSNNHFFTEATFNRIYSFSNAEFNRSGFSLGAGLTHRLSRSIVLDGTLRYIASNIGRENERSWNLQAAATLNILLSDSFKGSKSTVPGIGKGTWLTGVSDFALAGNDEEFGVDRQLRLKSKLLYFISDRWAIGTGFDLGVRRQRFTSFTFTSQGDVNRRSSKVGRRAFEFTPQVRYYFVAPQRIMFFATAGVGFFQEKTSTDTETAQILGLLEEEEYFNTQTIYAGLGANIFLTPNFAFEFGPNLSFDFDNEQRRFAIDMGLQIFFGQNAQKNND